MTKDKEILGVLFACDHRRCPQCYAERGECCHTSDIEHAKNFEKVGEAFFEVDDRAVGEWIYCEDAGGQDGYRCSKCGFFIPWYYSYEDIDFIDRYHRCPQCISRNTQQQ